MIKRYLGLAASYRAVAGWLVGDIVGTLRWGIAGLACLGVAVIVARIVTYGGFLLFLRSAVTGESTTIPWIDVTLPDVGVGVWVLAILISGLVLGGLIYAEVQMRAALSTRYALDAMRRAFDAFATSTFEGRGGNLDYREKVRLLGSDSWAMMRAAFPLLTTILPINQLFVATILLFAMSWEMAVVIVVIGLLYVAPFFVLNRRVAQASHQRQMSIPMLKREVTDALDVIAYPQYRAANIERGRRTLLDGEGLRQAIASYHVIRTTSGAVTLLNSVALALVMLVLMLYVSRAGSDIVLIGIVAYGMVLLHAYAAANTITSQIAAFNRFFPQFRRYVAILARRDAAGERGQASRSRLRLKLGAGAPLAGSLPSLVLEPGIVLLAIQPRRLTARTLNEWLAGIGVAPARRGDIFLAPRSRELPDRSLCEIGGSAIRRLLALRGVDESVADLPQGPETRWNSIEAPSPTLALAFAVAPALAAQTPPSAIVVPARSWNAVAEEVRAGFRDAFSETAWVIAGGEPSAEVTHILFADESGPIGMGDRDWGIRAMRKMADLPVATSLGAAAMDADDIEGEME